MYRIEKENNRISKLKEETFKNLDYKERQNLQEWIATNPECLDEELLIIQKEFDGFDDTRERLDLLALDKEGNIIVIENKLDDSGRDVTWQCIKYASYCSGLKKSQIIDIYQSYLDKNNNSDSAISKICDFYEIDDLDEVKINPGHKQRILLISRTYRKEVTSSVLWLLNYGLDIKCFQVTPYSDEDNLYLTIDQIIPIKAAEEFSIGIAEKTKEDITAEKVLKNRHVVRLKFWKELLQAVNEKTDMFKNISPSKYAWIGTGSGISGVTYNFVASKNYIRVELYIDKRDKEENENLLYTFKEDLDSSKNELTSDLVWEELSTKRACRIKIENTNFNIFNEKSWEYGISYAVQNMIRLEKAFQPLIKKLKS